MPAHPGEGGLCGLAHDLSELARDDQPALAGNGGGLDEEDVAADRRHGQARGHAGVGSALADLVAEALPPEPGTNAALVDAGGLPLARGDLRGGLAADRGDLAVEVPDAGLARVLGDDQPERLVAELDVLRVEPVRLELLRDEVALGDAELLLLGVAREADDLHPVLERRRDRLELIGRADEEHLREIEGQVQIVVAEARVLRGVEHLEHRARRIAAPVGAHLVDLVDHEDRVPGAGVADCAEDGAREGADVRAAVAANLGLVTDAPDGDAGELAPERRARSTGRARSCRLRAGRRSRGSGRRRPP